MFDQVKHRTLYSFVSRIKWISGSTLLVENYDKAIVRHEKYFYLRKAAKR